MNKHLKLAILVAPLLIVIGYIASDYYLEYQVNQPQLFKLETEGNCDILNTRCILLSGEFKISISDVNGRTKVKSNYPLEGVTLFVVDQRLPVKVHQLNRQTVYDWFAQTEVRAGLELSGSLQTLRIIVQAKGRHYISEFSTKAIE